MAQVAQINVNINTKNAIKSIGELNNEIGDSIVTVRDLQMTVSALQEELETTEVGTERWKELKQAYIDANTELKNYELSVESLDNEQFASELKSVVGGLTDMAGGLMLVGASGKRMEELVQVFAQVEGASRLVTGAMEAFTSGQKLMSAMTTRAAKAQEFLAAATLKGGVSAKIASVGMAILNAVMNLNPVFLILTAIIALVGALAFFVMSTNDAAEANERLNASMEAQNKLVTVQRDLRKQNQQLINNDLNNQKKILEGEKKLLESKENLTQADKDRISVIENEIISLDKLQVVAIKEESVKQNQENTQLILNQFAFLKNAIEATDYEDGVNDINYDEAIRKTNELRNQFVNAGIELRKTEDAEAYQKTISNLTNSAAMLSQEFSMLNFELGEAEQEEWKNTIEGADNLVQSLKEANTVAGEYITTIQDEKTTEALQTQLEIEKEANEQRERARKALERRKELLQSIEDLIRRERNAINELEQVRAQSIEDETERNLKLNELRFGAERDKLIEGAIKREESALQEKFINGKISEEEYRQSINDLYENGADYLLDVEKQLLEEKKVLFDEEEKEILRLQQVRVQQAKTTSEQIDVINQNTLDTLLQQEKQRRIFEAEQTIKDELKLQEELLKINKEYADKEIKQIQDILKEEIDLRTAQYQQDLSQKDLTLEQKRLLEAQYTNDVVQLNADAENQIAGIIMDSTETTTNSRIAKIQESFDKIVGGLQQGIDILNQALQESDEKAAYKREIQLEEDTESLNKQLANRTLSQTQYENKLAELEQKRRIQEVQQKRKQFKRDKANNISAAVMNLGQTVLSILATSPDPLKPIGPLVLSQLAVAGSLGAAQIGVIAGQTFKAARGGVVPGSPSMTDSVPSLLASGEMVINSTSSTMYGSLLSAINESGGGIPLVPQTPDGGTYGGGKSVYEENQKQQTIRAYVVETDVTDKQKRIKRIRENAEY